MKKGTNRRGAQGGFINSRHRRRQDCCQLWPGRAPLVSWPTRHDIHEHPKCIITKHHIRTTDRPKQSLYFSQWTCNSMLQTNTIQRPEQYSEPPGPRSHFQNKKLPDILLRLIVLGWVCWYLCCWSQICLPSNPHILGNRIQVEFPSCLLPCVGLADRN